MLSKLKEDVNKQTYGKLTALSMNLKRYKQAHEVLIMQNMNAGK